MSLSSGTIRICVTRPSDATANETLTLPRRHDGGRMVTRGWGSMYPPFPPLPGPESLPTPGPTPEPVPPPVPGPCPLVPSLAVPTDATTGATVIDSGLSVGGGSVIAGSGWGGGTVCTAGCWTGAAAAGAAAGRSTRRTDPPAPPPPPRGPKRSSPLPSTHSTPKRPINSRMIPWSRRDVMNPPRRRRGAGRRSGGGAGREGPVAGGTVIVATVADTYTAHGRRGTASLCPYATSRGEDSTATALPRPGLLEVG